MKNLVLKSVALAGLVAGGSFAVPTAEAACSAWGASTTGAYRNTSCTCSSATGTASYRPATSSLPGDGAGRIGSGNNSRNDIQIRLKCYNDAGNRYTYLYSYWDDGDYVFKACSSSYPLAVAAWCRIRPD
jgi:hypothetical protein